MKGLSQRLRDLVEGEQIIVSDTERSDIYKTAKRVDVSVKIEKFAAGFYVTRAGDAPPVRTQTARGVIGATDSIAHERYSKMIVPDSTPTPVVGPEPMPEPVADQWAGWSDERETIDRDRGETVTYREHLKSRKRREIRRETCDYSA